MSETKFFGGVFSASERMGGDADFEAFPSQSCPLCILEKRTHWYVEEDDFVILDCCDCDVPMAVYRTHAATPLEKDEIIAALREVADGKYGLGRWKFDEERGRAKDHWHVHARPMT